jgi:hypothetical protein
MTKLNRKLTAGERTMRRIKSQEELQSQKELGIVSISQVKIDNNKCLI